MEELKAYGNHAQSIEKNQWMRCHNRLLELEKENEELRERIRCLEKIMSETIGTLKSVEKGGTK